ncbi:uncharacterized protein [Nicotiana sylvestris]|uniref:uncharacterized protein n=1 Tax=Nicotiana sylvestris TaxID=4096 RepID=UPI00388CB9EA
MHRHSTPYRHKANGAIEAANKNIKNILRKMIQGSRQWHEKLPFALLGYRTTVRTSVGAQLPIEFAYGWFENGEARLLGTDLVRDALEKVKLIQDQLRTTQSRQRVTLIERYRDVSFLMLAILDMFLSLLVFNCELESMSKFLYHE